MRLTAIPSILLINFLTFGQERAVFKQLSIELGIKSTFMSASSEEIKGDCSGHCYYYYQVDEVKIEEIQGHLQLSYTYAGLMIPLSIGYLRWNQEIHGNDRGGYSLNTNPQYYGSSFSYKSSSEYGIISSGLGLNVFPSSEHFFLGPIVRANYALLIRNVVTTNESSYENQNATDYHLVVSEPSKHTVRPSVGLLVRYNFKSGLQLNLETGYNRSIENTPRFDDIETIRGGIYTQFNLGFDVNKFLKKEKSLDSHQGI